MFWQETKENERYTVPDDIVDVVYSIDCRALPVDHAYALSRAIQRALPWFAEEESAGLHTIHLAESGKLTGQTLDINGKHLRVEKSVVRPLSTITTLFSRYIVTREGTDEAVFLQDAMALFHKMGVHPKKMLCGMEHVIATPDRAIRARSLMLADLTVEESGKLQQQGFGTDRKLGCGLFIPHKDIKDLRPVLD